MTTIEKSIGTPNDYFTLAIDYESTQNAENNTSDVSIYCYVKRNNTGAWPSNTTSNAKCSINGNSKEEHPSYNLGSDGWKKIMEHTVNGIEHDDLGNKTINISFSFDGLLSNYYPVGTISQNIALPNIPRASTVACSSPIIGDTATITIDKKVDTFTSTVTYQIGTLTGTIATKTSATTLSLATTSLKSQIYALIPNAKKIEGTITCQTFNGNTSIGTKTCTFNLHVDDVDCTPGINYTAVDTNTTATSLTGSNTKFIKYISKPKITIIATPKNSSTIKSYSTKLGSQESTTRETTFQLMDSRYAFFNVVDSREYNAPLQATLDMVEYVKLHIDNLSVTRTESTSNEVVLNMNGAWFNGSFATNKANTLTITYQYKKSTDSSWTNGGTITPTKTGNTFKFTNLSLGNKYDNNSEYQFKFTIKDLAMTVISGDNDCQLEKGQEVMAIGDYETYFYGELLLNDKTFLNLTYPIGSIYMSINATNPSTLFGGTWQRITGRFLLGAIDGNATYGPGKTGGEETHILTIDEMPQHDHTYSKVTGGATYKDTASGSNYGDNPTKTSAVGGGQAHNNMPPYLAVYMWKRTA